MLRVPSESSEPKKEKEPTHQTCYIRAKECMSCSSPPPKIAVPEMWQSMRESTGATGRAFDARAWQYVWIHREYRGMYVGIEYFVSFFHW